MTINVVDAICGAGKSTSLINMINEDASNQRFLYVTPYLSEVERIKNACANKHFKEPIIGHGLNKLENIKELFKNGGNIVSTHALFKKFTTEIIEIIKEKEYILIMDEAIDVIVQMDITHDDLKTLANRYIKVGQENVVEWTKPDYEGKFEDYKEVIENHRVVASLDNRNKIFALTSFIPIEIFKAFKNVWILTYMFDCQIQKYYFDVYKFKYLYWYIQNFHLTLNKQIYNEQNIKKLIKVCNIPKINDIGNDKFALSVSWFTKKSSEEDIKKLKNNIYNFVRHIANQPAKKVIWTTFKKYQNRLKGKGFATSFVPLNMKATNIYADRTIIIYAANRYLNPHFQIFFKQNGIEVDNDRFALSELIQFIFRSAIRNNQEILIYLPSKRMREILQNWLDN